MFESNLDKEDMEQLTKLCGPGGKYDLQTEAGRQAVAVKVLERVRLEVPAFDIVPTVCMTDNKFKIGDTIEWWDLDGLTVYQHEPGSMVPFEKVVKKTFTATPNFYSVGAILHWVDLQSGRFGDLAGIQSMMRDRMVAEKSKRLWALLAATVTSSHANYTTSVGSLTKTSLDLAIKTIGDKGGRPKAILGRRLALDAILDFTGATSVEWSDTLKRQIESAGAVGSYRGVPIVQFPDFQDALDKSVIDNQNVYVLAEDAARYVPLTGMIMRQWEDKGTMDWRMAMSEYYALAIIDAAHRIYRIQIT